MLGKLFPYARGNRRAMLACVLVTMSEVVCEMLVPLLMSKIVDVGIVARDIAYIARIGLLMAVLSLLAILFGLLNVRYSSSASQGIAANLRRALFEKTQTFSFENIDSFSSASLVTRMTNDVTQLQTSLMMMLRQLIRAPMMLACALAISMSINLRLSLIVVAAIVLLLSGTLVVMRIARKLYTTMQKKLDALNSAVQENLTAIRVVKAFVRERYEREKFRAVNDEMTASAIRAGSMAALMMPGMTLVLNCSLVAVIWIGADMHGTGDMSTGGLMSFITYIMQILTSVMIFSTVLMVLTRARASAERIVEVLEAEPAVADRAETAAKKRAVARGGVEFREVGFRYAAGSEDENVLSGVSFRAEPGEIVGIIGETGSGKSTLAGLIPRFYDATSGAVLIDGVDVRDYAQKDLRDAVGIVMQKNNLFSGTIRENLLWGDEDADDESVVRAARSAQAHDFIMSLPEGYETELGQGGVNLSGGQKQRLCIARAMMKRPRILILDDSTSAVDTATEAKIRASFRRDFAEATVIVVTQRIASIRDADRIIVLEKGKVEAMGTHGELFATCGIYREICDSQAEGSLA